MDMNGSDQLVTLMNELNLGMQLSKQLKSHIGPESSTQTKQMLVTEIQSSYDSALSILGGSMEQPPRHMVPSIMKPAPSLQVPAVLESQDLKNQGFNGQQLQEDDNNVSGKRKKASWTKQVKVLAEDRPGGTPDDGHSWRKYGQKGIFGAIHPRSYYRCTYRHAQGCYAKKHVQRSDEDPTILNVTYKGNHTCSLTSCPEFAPTPAYYSPENQEPPSSSIDYQSLPTNMMFSSYSQQQGPSSGTVDISNTGGSFCSTATTAATTTRNMINIVDVNPSTLSSTINNYFQNSNFSASYTSPVLASSDSAYNYLSCSPTNMENYQGLDHQYQQHLEPDTDHEMLSTTVSDTNQPAAAIQLDQLNFDPSLPFDNPQFFA